MNDMQKTGIDYRTAFKIAGIAVCGVGAAAVLGTAGYYLGRTAGYYDDLLDNFFFNYATNYASANYHATIGGFGGAAIGLIFAGTATSEYIKSALAVRPRAAKNTTVNPPENSQH